MTKPAIPLIIRCYYNEAANSAKTSFRLMVGSYSNYTGKYWTESQMYAFVALDRSQPDAAPAFTAFTGSATDVPSGLAPFLNDNYILVFGFSGSITGVPQGALYEMLMANGGGASLQLLELWNTRFACGVDVSNLYSMISIPGTGTPGIETLSPHRTAAQFYPQTTSGIYSTLYDGLQTTINLIPDSKGTYTPVRMG
ncbi:MAG: hypothetical protein R6X02_32810 [Enhygromyxa sp.]